MSAWYVVVAVSFRRKKFCQICWPFSNKHLHALSSCFVCGIFFSWATLNHLFPLHPKTCEYLDANIPPFLGGNFQLFFLLKENKQTNWGKNNQSTEDPLWWNFTLIFFWRQTQFIALPLTLFSTLVLNVFLTCCFWTFIKETGLCDYLFAMNCAITYKMRNLISTFPKTKQATLAPFPVRNT